MMYSFRHLVLNLCVASVCANIKSGKKLQVLTVPQFKLKDQFFMLINSLCCCLRTDDVF